MAVGVRATARRLACAVTLLAGVASLAHADQLYFSAVDNVTNALVSKINAETVRIDMSAWYLSEHSISIAVANAFHRGVQIRLIGDRGAIFEIDAKTKAEFYWLASQGVPIRLRYNPTWYPEIDHWKATIFKGQNLVAFGSANYAPIELAPASSTNYADETTLFTTDPTLVGAFLTKFDVMWNDTTTEPNSIISGPPYLKNWNDACAIEVKCSDYRVLYPNPASMAINTARLEGNNSMPADLIWGQGPSFNNRLVQEINNEPRDVRFVVYRLTVDNVTQALLSKFQSGVSTRLIIEPNEYWNRKWPEFWLTHANLDKLWAAGVPIKQRQHEGMTHMKTLVTSTYATNASSNVAAAWQRDHDYFVSASTKPFVYQAVANRFETMWNDTSGFTNFVPGPPDAPTLSWPANGAAVSSTPTLTWNAAPFATSYDIYLGTSAGVLALAANVRAQLVNNPPATYSWAPPGLAASTWYFWKIVARTNATVRDPSLVASSATWAFATSGSQPPPPLPKPAAHTSGDFDGDGKADLGVWMPSTGTSYIVKSSTGYSNAAFEAKAWGIPGDVPVPGDYDGDGIADIAVWRPSNGTWYILKSSSGYSYSTALAISWGIPGDVPVPGDYDGDGKTDIAVWRPSTGMWYVLKSSSGYSVSTSLAIGWGLPGDVPVPGDYDGDGRADLAVWRPSTGTWWVLKSSGGYSYSSYIGKVWGVAGDVPVSADFDGDGRRDIAVWRPSTGTWWVLKSSSGYSYSAYFSKVWGIAGDMPVPDDYDGDGKADIAVWRPSTGTWFVLPSSKGYSYSAYLAKPWGVSGDVPLQ